MHKIISAVLALVAFTAVIVMGIVRNVEFVSALKFAGIAFLVDGGLGWIFFGPAGIRLMNEAVGEEDEEPPPRPAPKPEEPQEPEEKAPEEGEKESAEASPEGEGAS